MGSRYRKNTCTAVGVHTLVNHMLNIRRGRVEDPSLSFRAYSEELDKIPEMELYAPGGSSTEAQMLVTEAMLACTTGMLLCLDREQRLTYILGAILRVSDVVA